MGSKLILKALFFSKNGQNNGQVTVIVVKQSLRYVQKKSRKTPNTHAKEIILVKI